MAGLRAWFRQVAQAVEEEIAKQRDDHPGTRPGHATYHREEPAPDAEWEPERETAHAPPRPWKAQTTRSPWNRSTPGRAPETHGAQPAGRSPWDTNESRGSLPYAHASPNDALLERIRARLGYPDALREAFVVKEILDRPLARRHAR